MSIVIGGTMMTAGMLSNTILYDRKRCMWVFNDDTWAGKLFDKMLDSLQVFNFSSDIELLNILTKRNNAKKLPDKIKIYHPRMVGVKITIKMTGSYIMDFIEAAKIARMFYGVNEFDREGRIYNYIWHHCEHINITNSGVLCDMELLHIDCHNTPHCGGVSEYESVFGRYR